MDALAATFHRIAHDDQARVVVLRGAGEKAWIGGADVREMVRLSASSAETFIRRVHNLCRRVRELPVPVIAAIQGWCLGAGLEVAACCDLRLASEDARFGMPEVRLGLPSVVEAAVLPALIGTGRARDLVLTGRIVGCEEALRWGLVDGLTPRGELEALVETRIGEILAGAPRAMRLQKRLCRNWDEQPMSEAVEAGIRVFAQAFRSPEPEEYLRRFLDRPRDEG